MNQLADPTAFGLPERFTHWRPGQEDALLRALDRPERFVALVLPTGSGKSLIYMAASKLSGKRAVVLTSTKALQRQLMRDFPMPGVSLVKGQGSYTCIACEPGGELRSEFGQGHMTTMVDHGPCHLGVQCSKKLGGCFYFDALRASFQAEIVVTNYAWWLTQYEIQGPKLRPDLLVLDEAHDAPDALADQLGASIDREDAHAFCRDALPPSKASDWTSADWSVWTGDQANRLRQMLAGTQPTTMGAAKALRRAQWLMRSLTRISLIDPRLLLVSDSPDGFRFDVVWAAPHAESHLFRGAPKVLLTSATFARHTAELLGIVPNDLHWFELNDGFPVERRPVYRMALTPSIRVDHRISPQMEALWIDRIDRILDARSDRKGVIHTVSYRRRDAILTQSRHRARMVTHGRHDTAQRIRAFKEAPPSSGLVFLSPAITTGYDFPYNECEYQIIAKIPFPDKRDPVTAARTMIDPSYGNYVAMRELVQAVGRGMRAADDQCETFLLDDHAGWFLSKNAALAPRWFRRAIVHTDEFPVPPPPLGSGSSHAAPSEDE